MYANSLLIVGHGVSVEAGVTSGQTVEVIIALGDLSCLGGCSNQFSTGRLIERMATKGCASAAHRWVFCAICASQNPLKNYEED
ncbi:MAG: hypothetical protein VBE63_17555 [Lamprobacter sp.]|uniref:hypothetical protein n=1 Tax=Lamprobacter sp. TaxID=3100796 RepID=UPI002B257876|nr:hypothetical protein [Lamprobacter sp.]MEA3641724.1 hypothetical protein [Lamprobacter sp.]